MAGLSLVGGPYDGADLPQPFSGAWVYVLSNGRITTKPEYGERQHGALYRAVARCSLDRRRSVGSVLLYAGDRFKSCANCRGAFVTEGGRCTVCSVKREVVHD